MVAVDAKAMIAADLAEIAENNRRRDAYIARRGVPGRCYCGNEVSILGQGSNPPWRLGERLRQWDAPSTVGNTHVRQAGVRAAGVL